MIVGCRSMIQLGRRRLYRALVLLTVLGLAFSGCAPSPAIQSNSDFDPAAKFLDWRTFAWISGQPLIVAPGSSRPLNPGTQEAIEASIVETLNAKGYAQVLEVSQADFVVSYTIGARDETMIEELPGAYGGFDWGWGMNSWQLKPQVIESKTVETKYVEGTLAIDIFDARTKQPAWHGWASAALRSLPASKKLVDKVVKSILAKYPATAP